MKTRLAIGLLFLFPALLFALGEESFGNAPVARQPDWADGVLECANLKTRVYRQWVNGNENFFYQGNAAALNEAMAKFADIKGGPHEVVLLPGSGKAKTFDGKEVDFDWRLHVPSGIYKAVTKKSDPSVTVFIPFIADEVPVDRQRAQEHIAELDSDKFATRENAVRELAKYGAGIKPLLREALRKDGISAERKKSLEGLLDRFKGLDVADLLVPKSVKLATVGDLIESAKKEFKESTGEPRGRALHELVTLAPYDDRLVAFIADALKNETHQYVRQSAAGGLAHLGAKAKPALAILKVCLEDNDKYIKEMCAKAVEAIDKAKPENPEEAKRLEATLKAIAKFKEGK